MFTEAIEEDPWSLRFVPDHFRTQEIGAEAVRKEPYFLQEIPDHLKTRGICRGSTQRVILIGICPRQFQDPRNVC